jgi:hypothetical protein
MFEIVHDGNFIIFYFRGRYYQCSRETFCKILLKEIKIEEAHKRAFFY